MRVLTSGGHGIEAGEAQQVDLRGQHRQREQEGGHIQHDAEQDEVVCAIVIQELPALPYNGPRQDEHEQADAPAHGGVPSWVAFPRGQEPQTTHVMFPGWRVFSWRRVWSCLFLPRCDPVRSVGDGSVDGRMDCPYQCQQHHRQSLPTGRGWVCVIIEVWDDNRRLGEDVV